MTDLHHQRPVSLRSHTAGAGQGPVAVEVGEGLGAVVLWTTAQLAGLELDISAAGDPTHRHHVAVLGRQLPLGTRYAAVYPALAAGRYTIWHPDGQGQLDVEVPPGVVTEVSWPAT